MFHGQVGQEDQGFFSGDPLCQVAPIDLDDRCPQKGKMEMSAVFFSLDGFPDPGQGTSVDVKSLPILIC